MWGRSRVVVIVPAWNEAPRVGRVLRGMPTWVDRIVVVDDASQDGTGDAVSDVADSRVELVSHAVNRGVGAAIVTGYRRALDHSGTGRDAFVVMAGDGQMDPRDLPEVVGPIERGQADYVKGTRFRAAGVKTSMPASRWLGGLVLSWATARAVGLAISDSQCGYTAIAREVCARLDLDGLWPRYGYPNDLLSQLALRGMRIAETNVRPVYGDEVSRLKARHVPAIVALIARAWLRRVAKERRGGPQ
jgi:glycosyltransferase involved in cell wall biosynthesis